MGEGAVAGTALLGMLEVSDSREGKASPAVYSSLMATLRVAPRYEVLVEAMGQYNFLSGVNPGGRDRLNNVKYGLAVGTRHYFDDGQLYDFFCGVGSGPWQKGWELSASYGWGMPLGTGMGMHASGSSMAVSAGYWFNRLLGARFGLTGSQGYYRKRDVPAVVEPVGGIQVHAPYTVYYSRMMMGGRAEVLLNPLNLLPARRRQEAAPRWDMTLSAGMNFGGMHKAGSFTCGYAGFTTSAALLYRLSNAIQLYSNPVTMSTAMAGTMMP